MPKKLKKDILTICAAAGLLINAGLFAADIQWEEHYENGIKCAMDGRFDEATREFTYALAFDPFLIHVSSCAQISVDASSGKIKAEAARAIFSGIDLGNKNKWDEAIAELGKAAELESSYASIFNERGIAFACSGKNEKAVSDFTKAIELKPNYEYAYSNRAYAYAHLGSQGKALSDFDEAVKINPYYALGYYNRGVFYSAYMRLYEHAINDFTKAIEAYQRFGDAYVDRGVVYYQLGEHDKAIKDFDRAIEIDPEDTRAYWNKAVCLEAKGRVVEAIETYEDVLRLAKPGSEYIDDANSEIKKLRVKKLGIQP